ncbi:hypothetical protein [Campylobacter gastrosuis]|uniref:Uncharacterized protein n=1 Tax=Campylobacter gastrosuis TaxID=2974576 RepID=A0ABT7HLT0_9BACT|nr:hypothetical protein [Campylobacter gastrosuis]MDL0087912.1 hypothetical protein [Campylobacter gastrosuis]
MDFSATTFNNKFLREILPVYDAPNLSSKKLEISELSELSKSVDSLANSHDIKVNNGKSDFKNTIYFKDAISGNYIKIGLSNENLNTINRVFGSDDVFKNDDGSVILNGNAQNFVSSWFVINVAI